MARVNLKMVPKFIVKKIDGVLRPKEASSNYYGNYFFEKLIKGHSIQALLTQHLCVLLTFGINSPILAVIMALTISVVCFIWQFLIIRYIKYNKFNEDSPRTTETADSLKDGIEEGANNPLLGSTVSPKISSKKSFTKVNTPPTSKKITPVSSSKNQERSSDLTATGYYALPADANRVSDNTDNLSELQPESEIEFPSLTSSFRDSNLENNSNNPFDASELFEADKQEETRLNELNTIIDDSWLCVYHSRWLLLYISMAFYVLILFDFSGDENGGIHAIWIPALILFLVLFTRISLSDILKYIQISSAQ